MSSATESLASIGPTSADSETCEKSPVTTAPGLLAWLAASHAKTCPTPGMERVFWLARVLVFGSSSAVLLALHDPASYFWKTCQLSLLETEPSYLDSLPKWGMTRDGALYQQPTPERPTLESGGSAWPTPKATEINETIEAWDRRRRIPKNKMMGPSLTVAIQLWATPTSRDWRNGKASPETMERNARPLNEQVTNWPTPQARDYRSGDQPDSERAQRKQVEGWTPNLNDVVLWPSPKASHDAMNGGQNGVKALRGTDLEHQRMNLNPDWVEALMGYPPGWTLPDGPPVRTKHSTTGNPPEPQALKTGVPTGCALSVTPLFRQWFIP